MLWGYVNLSQFLIIWSGNLPEETTWYLDRSQGVWKQLTYLLVALHFFLPFFTLLSAGLKKNASRLAAMERADRNIKDLLEHLHGRFHRLRQGSIDEELFDVTAGYEALART